MKENIKLIVISFNSIIVFGFCLFCSVDSGYVNSTFLFWSSIFAFQKTPTCLLPLRQWLWKLGFLFNSISTASIIWFVKLALLEKVTFCLDLFHVYACVYITWMPGLQGSQKKAHDSLVLELWMVVCCHVGVKLWASVRASVHNAEPPPALLEKWLKKCFGETGHGHAHL